MPGGEGLADHGQTVELSPEERRLLDAAQSRFPLVAEPYSALGREAGLSEEAVLGRFREWRGSGLLRRLGPVFDSQRLGYQSALLAARVAPAEVERVAQGINASPGVTHNYLRDDAGTGFNLWFTLTVGPQEDLAATAADLAARVGLADSDYRILPATRLYKIRVEFPLGGKEQPAGRPAPQGDQRAESAARGPAGDAEALSEEEWRVIRAFEPDLPLISRPFAAAAEPAGLSGERALEILVALRRSGVIRRFGATLKHYAVGYPANAMSVWQVEPEDQDRVGRVLAGSPLVSHCYARPTPPGWPYALYAMIHAPSREECRAEAQRLAAEAGVSFERYRLLFTERELKKERMWYGGERE